MQIAGLAIGLKTAVAAGVIGLSGVAVTAGVVLPSQANGHAKTAVTHATPNPHASFGQCVAANAKTASEHKGDHGAGGWNPTQGCDKPGASGSHSAPGLAKARSHANPAASPGLGHATDGGSNHTP